MSSRALQDRICGVGAHGVYMYHKPVEHLHTPSSAHLTTAQHGQQGADVPKRHIHDRAHGGKQTGPSSSSSSLPRSSASRPIGASCQF